MWFHLIKVKTYSFEWKSYDELNFQLHLCRLRVNSEWMMVFHVTLFRSSYRVAYYQSTGNCVGVTRETVCRLKEPKNSVSTNDKSIVLKLITYIDRSRNFFIVTCFAIFWTRKLFIFYHPKFLACLSSDKFYVLTCLTCSKALPGELSVQLANQYISIISWLMFDFDEKTAKKLENPTCLTKKKTYDDTKKKSINFCLVMFFLEDENILWRNFLSWYRHYPMLQIPTWNLITLSV